MMPHERDSAVDRCRWVNMNNPLYVQYHDAEWGVASHDDAYLYEMLVLEGFVAGLSWECVLNKREAFRAAFAGFDAAIVAQYGEAEVANMLLNPKLIRHRRKIEAAISNSRVFVQIQAEFGSFAHYAWSFVQHRQRCESYHARVSSPESDALSRDLKRRGMRFMGSVTLHAWMQAVGIFCAHGEECYLHTP